jgi:hypothetical protein
MRTLTLAALLGSFVLAGAAQAAVVVPASAAKAAQGIVSTDQGDSGMVLVREGGSHNRGRRGV